VSGKSGGNGDWPGFLDLRHGSEREMPSAPRPTVLPEHPQRLDPGDGPQFHRRLVDFLRRNRPAGQPIVAGDVQVLDLDGVRRHFGPRWDTVKQKLYQLTDLTVRHHIAEGDLYFLADEEEFVIMFARAGKAEATVKARAIAAEVNAKLGAVGIEGAAVTVHGLAVELPRQSLEGSQLTARQIRRAIAEAAGEERPPPPEPRALPRLAADPEPLRVEYWPVANVRKRLVSIYDARLVGGADGPLDAIGRYMTDVDCLFVGAAAETLQRAQLPHHKACLLIAAHYETLQVKTFRDTYIDACRSLPQVARRRLILEILQLPAAVPQSRLHQVLGVVAPFFLGFAIRVPLGFHTPERFRGMRVVALTVEGRNLPHPSTREFDQLLALADAAKRHKIRTMFLNAAAVEAATAARYAHCEYIDGEVVGPRVADPGRSYALKRSGG
jgi:hypothetical protein